MFFEIAVVGETKRGYMEPRNNSNAEKGAIRRKHTKNNSCEVCSAVSVQFIILAAGYGNEV